MTNSTYQIAKMASGADVSGLRTRCSRAGSQGLAAHGTCAAFGWEACGWMCIMAVIFL